MTIREKIDYHKQRHEYHQSMMNEIQEQCPHIMKEQENSLGIFLICVDCDYLVLKENKLERAGKFSWNQQQSNTK